MHTTVNVGLSNRPYPVGFSSTLGEPPPLTRHSAVIGSSVKRSEPSTLSYMVMGVLLRGFGLADTYYD